MMMVPVASTFAPGVYWLAHMFTTSSGTSTTGGGNYAAGTCFNNAPGRLMLLENVLSAFKQLGTSSVGTSVSTQGVPFHGYLATTTSNASASLGSGNMTQTTGRLYWNYIQDSV